MSQRRQRKNVVSEIWNGSYIIQPYRPLSEGITPPNRKTKMRKISKGLFFMEDRLL